MPPQFTTITSHVAPLLADDVDTDQIIPARYLKGISRTGLGAHLFEDWGTLPDGTLNPDFALNQPESQDAEILLAGRNFGCGSSREHAPWALLDAGFRVVIARSFADIFYNNALKNGLLPVAMDETEHAALSQRIERDHHAQITVDLTHQKIEWPEAEEASFEIDEFSRRCLTEGIDQLGYLMSMEEHIREYEAAHEAG
jgi:3-isopropylmalate/(R)-2-methylmalate dehydratase small subunit